LGELPNQPVLYDKVNIFAGFAGKIADRE